MLFLGHPILATEQKTCVTSSISETFSSINPLKYDSHAQEWKFKLVLQNAHGTKLPRYYY